MRMFIPDERLERKEVDLSEEKMNLTTIDEDEIKLKGWPRYRWFTSLGGFARLMQIPPSIVHFVTWFLLNFHPHLHFYVYVRPGRPNRNIFGLAGQMDGKYISIFDTVRKIYFWRFYSRTNIEANWFSKTFQWRLHDREWRSFMAFRFGSSSRRI